MPSSCPGLAACNLWHMEPVQMWSVHMSFARCHEGWRRAVGAADSHHGLGTVRRARAGAHHAEAGEACAFRWPQSQSVALLHAAVAEQAGNAAEADNTLARAAQSNASGRQSSWPLLMRAQLAASRGAIGKVCWGDLHAPISWQMLDASCPQLTKPGWTQRSWSNACYQQILMSLLNIPCMTRKCIIPRDTLSSGQARSPLKSSDQSLPF